MKKILQDLSYYELENLITEYGEKKFRAGQIFRGLMRGEKISDLTEISNALKEKLLQNYENESVKILEKFESKDGSIKLLFELADGNIIEGVLMSYKYGNSQCVSTQVGCRMGCKFCASTLNGLIRNLSSGEIISQILVVNKMLGGKLGDDRKVTNVVLMGSGEPLDNYDNTLKFLKNVSAEGGITISQRNISLSTCGLVDNMLKLADEKVSVNLTVSLHSPFDEERKTIMPVANKYKIAEILKACDYYFSRTKRRYIFEYSLISQKNCDERHAEALIKLLKGRPCHVNLIRLNEVKERDLKTIKEQEAQNFLQRLQKGGLSATLRRIIGEDVGGACGQLRAGYVKEK